MKPPPASLYGQVDALIRSKHYEDAHELLLSRVQKYPQDPVGWRLLTHILVSLGRYEQAKVCVDNALRLTPWHAATFNLAGVVAKHLGAMQEAIAHYQCALRLMPNDRSATFNLGLIYAHQGAHEVAIDWFAQASDIDPADADVQYHWAVSLEKLGRISLAIHHFEQAIALHASQSYLRGHCLHLKARQYDWQEWHGAIDKIKEEIMQGIACALPFHVVTLIDDVVVQRQAANVFLSNQRLFGVSDGSVQPLRSNHQRVRLAYLSCDFYDHATSHLMWALLREHDRAQFEVWVFGWDEKSQDPMHQTIQSLADRYVNLSALSDEASVSLIRSHQIDVAIDLKGYTHGARAAIFAQRCAPIQIAYLGYPATTGMAQIDYIVADHHLINAEEQSQFSEKILWMPTCYQVNSGRPLNTETDCSRPEWGLPEEAFVFASFNRGYKLTPDCFASWMNILQAAPHSVLWLLEDDIDAQRQLVEHVQAAGVAANRLIFCKSIGHDAHLLRIQLAQVCLDTFPCGGHTTTSDVLRAGVPLVTYRGQSWMSRVSSSLLYALGLDDWVTTCVQDYQDWAIRAAHDPSWLNQQRQRLQIAAQQSSLFDVVQWTRDFEQLLTRVVDPPPP